MYMEIATMIEGRIMGSSRMTLKTLPPFFMVLLVIPNAAEIPSVQASTMVQTAIRRLFHAAFSHLGLEKKSRYQRREKLLGGNSRKSEPPKDMGMMMSTGMIKKNRTSPQTIYSQTGRRSNLEIRVRMRHLLDKPFLQGIHSEKAVENPEEQDRDQQEDHAEGGAERPIQERKHLPVDEP